MVMQWREHWTSKVCGSPYLEFLASTGIHGLAKKTGDRIDLLMVIASKPGTGQFREFIKALKQNYQTICVWQIFNPILDAMLTRYGFSEEVELQGDGEVLRGYRWDKS